jgi:hypothetical protein
MLYVAHTLLTGTMRIFHASMSTNRCYRRRLMDVRFNRVPEAIAAFDDLSYLHLISGKNKERPRTIKVLPRAVTFNCCIYEQPAATAATTTATTTAAAAPAVATVLEDQWQQQQQPQQQPQQQQKQWQLPVVSSTLTSAVLTPAAAVPQSRQPDKLLPLRTATTATGSTATANTLNDCTTIAISDTPIAKHSRWDEHYTDKTLAAAAAAAIDPATIRDSYDELQTAPAWGPNPYDVSRDMQ